MAAPTETPNLLIVGLGNPGSEFDGTRHNVGADAVELLASRHGGRFKVEKRAHARCADVRIETQRCLLAIPTTYMNDSGLAVRALIRHWQIDPLTNLIVVHDELDLAPGVVRVKNGGGTAGHNGLRSIQSHIKSLDFLRVRIGIGKPPNPQRGADHVLARPSAAVREALGAAVQTAADAVDCVVSAGVERAMDQFNSSH